MSGMDLETKVEILRNDVAAVNATLNKLDTAIDKIADATGGISKILAVHDNEIAERKRLSEKETELLHKRISELKDENTILHEKHHNEIMRSLKESQADMKELATRVHQLERWKWWIMGGSWAIGFAIATLLQIGGLVTIF